MKEIKKIGVLTSGGDAPGMNAAVRAVVRTAIFNGIEVKGVLRGYDGLIKNSFMDLNARSVGETLQRGGTFLQTARCPELKTEEGLKLAVKHAKESGIDGLIVIGGDGTFRGARALSAAGIPTIAIPATIDNDISCTEYTLGYDTCLNTVIDAVDKLRDTCSSHERCSVVEVMGRGAGHIAMETAVACGAEVVLIPERPFDVDKDVIDVIKKGKDRGKQHNIVIVAEGVGGVVELAKKIEDETGVETRATILGHVQRGGSPTAKDRVMASLMGSRAVELVMEGKQDRIIRVENNKISDVDIEEGLAMKKDVSEDLIKLAVQLAI